MAASRSIPLHWTRRWALAGGAVAAMLLAALAGCTTCPKPPVISQTNPPQAVQTSSVALPTDGTPVIQTGEQVLVTGSLIRGTAALRGSAQGGHRRGEGCDYRHDRRLHLRQRIALEPHYY